MRLDASAYSLPPELLRYFEYARTHKLEVIEPKVVPMLPIRIQGDFYDFVYTAGPLLKRHVVPGTGRLLGVA